MSTRIEQREQRKKEILVAALNLFVEKGYAATKTSDIAQILQISDGLLFHYFPTKEALYRELVAIGLKSTAEPFLGTEMQPIQFFHQIITDFFEAVKMDRTAAKMFVLMEQAQNKNTAPASVYEIAKQVNTIENSVKIIKNGQEDGSIRQGDPLALSYAFWNAFQGVMQALATDSRMPVPETDWIMAILRNPLAEN